MDTVARLSHALDVFAGICAVGHLTGPSVATAAGTEALSLKVSGSVWWHDHEYPIALWTGEGPSGSPEDDSMWLRLGGREADLSEDVEGSGVFDPVPVDVLPAVVAGVRQASLMVDIGTAALLCAETQYDVEAILGQLQQVAGASKIAALHEVEALSARLDLLRNCAVDLLGNMAVTESQDVHLNFDVTADTLDPETGKPVRLRVCWAPEDDVSHNYTHAFELAGVKCEGHDDADFDRMLAAYPEASREHYRHAFTHLHQAAHAVGEYAAGRVGQALAEESTLEDPLLHVDRHEVTHRVHSEVAAELDTFVKEMAGRPGRGDEHEDRQHQH